MNPYAPNAVTETKRPWPQRWAFTLTIVALLSGMGGGIIGFSGGYYWGMSETEAMQDALHNRDFVKRLNEGQ